MAVSHDYPWNHCNCFVTEDTHLAYLQAPVCLKFGHFLFTVSSPIHHYPFLAPLDSELLIPHFLFCSIPGVEANKQQTKKKIR